MRYTAWYVVTLRRGYAAVSAYGPRRGAARLGATRRGVPRRGVARLTYLSAAAPPATGSAASVQSGVLPICIPDSPPGQSNDSPVYPFSLYRASLRLLRPPRSHPVSLLPLPPRFLSPRPLSMPLKRPRIILPDIERRRSQR